MKARQKNKFISKAFSHGKYCPWESKTFFNLSRNLRIKVLKLTLNHILVSQEVSHLISFLLWYSFANKPPNPSTIQLYDALFRLLKFVELLSDYNSLKDKYDAQVFLAEYLPVWQQQKQQQIGIGSFC